ncbi:GtrA family protein [Enterocloster bolteae]|uniref:GtrA family protein n=1 Tax=Enterocloster bolteae TaxID=208479 RepID=UPI00189CB184
MKVDRGLRSEVFRYTIAGILTTIVNYSIYAFLTWCLLDAQVFFAYVINHQWVFQSKSKDIVKEFTGFLGTRFLTLLLDILIMSLLVSLMLMNDKIAKIISIIVTTIANYLLSKRVVFRL